MITHPSRALIGPFRGLFLSLTLNNDIKNRFKSLKGLKGLKDLKDLSKYKFNIYYNN